MSMMLPPDAEGLINAVLVLTAGDVFPKADEDMLRLLANNARVFANGVGNEVGGLDSLVASVVQGLDTSAGRQFARYGHHLDEFGTGLTGQANKIGDGLEDFALNVENAKYQMVIGSTITATMIAWALVSPWGAALVPSYLSGLRTFVVNVFGRYTNTMAMVLKGMVTESAQELSSAFLSQLIQVFEGNRKEFDGKDLGISAGVGAGAGAFAPLVGAVINAAPSVWKKEWRNAWENLAGTHKPAAPPSVAFRLTANTLTEAITELVVSAATLPLGGSLTGLGFSTVSGIFSGFTETGAEIVGERLYEKHHTPAGPPPPPPGLHPNGGPPLHNNGTPGDDDSDRASVTSFDLPDDDDRASISSQSSTAPLLPPNGSGSPVRDMGSKAPEPQNPHSTGLTPGGDAPQVSGPLPAAAPNPTTADPSPTSRNSSPSTSSSNAATSGPSPSSSSTSPTSSNPNPTSSNSSPTSSNSSPTSSNPSPTSSNPSPTSSNPKATGPSSNLATSSPGPASFTSNPTTSNSNAAGPSSNLATSSPGPTSSNPSPTSSSASPTSSNPSSTSNSNPATSNSKTTAPNSNLASSGSSPTSFNPNPTSSNSNPTTSNSNATGPSSNLATSSPSPTSSNLSLTTSSPSPTSSNLSLTTSSPSPTSSNPSPVSSSSSPTGPNANPTTSDGPDRILDRDIDDSSDPFSEDDSRGTTLSLSSEDPVVTGDQKTGRPTDVDWSRQVLNRVQAMSKADADPPTNPLLLARASGIVARHHRRPGILPIDDTRGEEIYRDAYHQIMTLVAHRLNDTNTQTAVAYSAQLARDLGTKAPRTRADEWRNPGGAQVGDENLGNLGGGSSNPKVTPATVAVTYRSQPRDSTLPPLDVPSTVERQHQIEFPATLDAAALDENGALRRDEAYFALTQTPELVPFVNWLTRGLSATAVPDITIRGPRHLVTGIELALRRLIDKNLAKPSVRTDIQTDDDTNTVTIAVASVTDVNPVKQKHVRKPTAADSERPNFASSSKTGAYFHYEPPPPPKKPVYEEPKRPNPTVFTDPPSEAIVSVGVPKGRLPSTNALFSHLSANYPDLANADEALWSELERELGTKYRQIAYDVRRLGTKPPMSHPFTIGGRTFFISLELEFEARIDDPSAERDGLIGNPSPTKTGKVRGVDTVNGQYDLGTTNNTTSGNTAYTQISLGPNQEFPMQDWTLGVPISVETEINRSQRTIGTVKDAEIGNVEDARTALEYLSYDAKWVIRGLNADGTFTPPTRVRSLGERLTLTIAEPYVHNVSDIQSEEESESEKSESEKSSSEKSESEKSSGEESDYQSAHSNIPNDTNDTNDTNEQHTDDESDYESALENIPDNEQNPTEQHTDEESNYESAHSNISDGTTDSHGTQDEQHTIIGQQGEEPEDPPVPLPAGHFRLPDHYFASGLTNMDELYVQALSLLQAENIQNFDRNSIITKLWNLETNLHSAAGRDQGYRFPVYDDKAQAVALIQINTTLLPEGVNGGDRDLVDSDGNRTPIQVPGVERVGSVSDQVHIEDVATAIDGLQGSHNLTQTSTLNVGATGAATLPDKDVGLSGGLSFQVKPGSSNGVAASRVSLWVHVARFTGRTGAYQIPMIHEITVINPNTPNPRRTRQTASTALVRVPEREAPDRQGSPEPESPVLDPEPPPAAEPGNDKDFSTGVGMGLVRVDDYTVTRIHDHLTDYLTRAGFLHGGEDDSRLDSTKFHDSVRTHKQLGNAITLDKLVSQSGLRANFDMIHQDGYTFTLEVPERLRFPGAPTTRMKAAKITISATPSQLRDNTLVPTFVGTSDDFHTVNLAMGMTSASQSLGGTVTTRASGKFNLFWRFLRNVGLLGGGYSYTWGASNEAKLMNNRPELLEYAHRVEQWTTHSDYRVTIEYQDAAALTRELPAPQPFVPRLNLPDQRATVYTLDFVRGLDKGVRSMGPPATAPELPDRILDNAVVYKLDTTGLRRSLMDMMAAFDGPAGYADQELSTLAGTVTMRAFLKEALRGTVYTELPFIPGWRKDLHGTAGISARILELDFGGATTDPFTLGIIKLGLVGTSMSRNASHNFFSDMGDVTFGGSAGDTELSGGHSFESSQNFGESEKVSREAAFERIQLKFGPAYKFRARVRLTVEASSEYGGKFIAPDLIHRVLNRPAGQPGGTGNAGNIGNAEEYPLQFVGNQAGNQPTNGPGQPAPAEIYTMVEFLLPERDALIGYAADQLPLTNEQLTDVMTRFVAAANAGDAPPISGNLAAQVLIRWKALQRDHALINGFAAEVLKQHQTDDPIYIVDRDAQAGLAPMVPEAVVRQKPRPFTVPGYLTGPEHQRMLGHSGITSVTYQTVDEDNTTLRANTTLYDTIRTLASNFDPRALGYTVVPAGQNPPQSRLKPIQGAAEGLEGVFGQGRDDAFIDDFLSANGYTFYLINPHDWLASSIIAINVKMQLKGDPQFMDVDPKSGMENYTHGYTGTSRTGSRGGGLSITGRLTANLTKNGNSYRATPKLSANTGFNRSLSTGSTVVSEQTVYDWGGHADYQATHETLVTVSKLDMAERWTNNMYLSLPWGRWTDWSAWQQSMRRMTGFETRPGIEQHWQRLYGKVSIELPLSIVRGSRPAQQPPRTGLPDFVGGLPGDATVSGNILDGLAPAAQRMMDRIEESIWGLPNLGKMILRTPPFATNPSPTLQSLLMRTQLNGHIPAAIGGRVHRLAENLIIPGHPNHLITVDMVGELFRRDAEVVWEMTGSGSGRYSKFISNSSHAVKVDTWRGSVGVDLGSTNTSTRDQPVPPPTVGETGHLPDGGTPSQPAQTDGTGHLPQGSRTKPTGELTKPQPYQILGAGFNPGRSTALGLQGAENRGLRWESHQKPQIERQEGHQTPAGQDDKAAPDDDSEKMYLVKFRGHFRLIATVHNAVLPVVDRYWRTFRTNWVDGPVYVTMTKSQYDEMMKNPYNPTVRFQEEMNTPPEDDVAPDHVTIDNRFTNYDNVPQAAKDVRSRFLNLNLHGNALVNRTQTGILGRAVITRLVEKYYPALMAHDVPRRLHTDLTTTVADDVLVTMLTDLDSANSDPEQAASDIATALRDIRLDTLDTPTAKQVTDRVRQHLSSSRRPPAQNAAASASTSNKPVLVRPPVDDQRAHILELVAAQAPTLDRNEARQGFEMLDINRVTDLLRGVPNQLLADGVMARMIVGDTNLLVGKFQEVVASHSLNDFFSSNSTWTEQAFLDFLLSEENVGETGDQNTGTPMDERWSKHVLNQVQAMPKAGSDPPTDPLLLARASGIVARHHRRPGILPIDDTRGEEIYRDAYHQIMTLVAHRLNDTNTQTAVEYSAQLAKDLGTKAPRTRADEWRNPGGAQVGNADLGDLAGSDTTYETAPESPIETDEDPPQSSGSSGSDLFFTASSNEHADESDGPPGQGTDLWRGREPQRRSRRPAWDVLSPADHDTSEDDRQPSSSAPVEAPSKDRPEAATKDPLATLRFGREESDTDSEEAEASVPAWRRVQREAEQAREDEQAREAKRAGKRPVRPGDKPPAPPRAPEPPRVEIQLPPPPSVVSIGVPKGRMPAVDALFAELKQEFPQLRSKPPAFWGQLDRALLAKHGQISYDAHRRGNGGPPPVSHPFVVDGITLFISLELEFDRLLTDASAARDGVPGDPGDDKLGKVEGVDAVNGKYDLGPTTGTMSGSTTYTAISANPNFSFPKDTWVPSLNLGLEFDINRSNRTIGSLTDAEFGNVEDARTELEYLLYRPTWVVRVQNDDATFRTVPIDTPTREAQLRPTRELMVLGVAGPYLRDVPDVLPARPAVVPDDSASDDQQAPAAQQQNQQAPPPRRPNPDLPTLPDHYYASGLTGIDTMYQHALEMLAEHGLADVDTASIVTKLWNLETNLHTATRGGYRFPVFDKQANIVALLEVDTMMFPAGFEAVQMTLGHDDTTGEPFVADIPPVQRIGSVSDKVHIEDVATAIDGLSGSHNLSQSAALNAGFTAKIEKPGNSDVGMSAALNSQLKSGNTNGVSTSRTALWVHVARFTGRTGAYSVPMVHRIRLIDPSNQNSPTRRVPGVGMVRVPEKEAARRDWPLEPESPFRNPRPRTSRGVPGNTKDFSRGVGMGLVRVDDTTVERIHGHLRTELARRGFLHDSDTQLRAPRFNDSLRSHKQFENTLSLDKLVSQAGLRANFDMAHQDGYTFALDVPTDNIIPGVPSVPGVAGRMKTAKITIRARTSREEGQPRQPTFVQTTNDFHTVNLAMGMATAGHSVGGSIGLKLGGKFSIFKKVLNSFGVLGGGYNYSQGTSNEAKVLNNRPELLEYAHEVEEWTAYSDWEVHIEYQDAPMVTRKLPAPEPRGEPYRLLDQPATVYTLDFVNGHDKGVAPLNPDADLNRRHRHFLDNAVVHKLDATDVRPQLLRMLSAFAGPAGYADQELSTFGGTTSMRAFLKEAIQDGIFTELPFIPGWFTDKHGSATIRAEMLNARFDGATKDSFTLGIIKLGLVSASMGENKSHTWYTDMFDTKLGGQINTGELNGNLTPEHKQVWGSSRNISREAASERIQLKFGPAYKYRVPIRFHIETSTEYGGKFIPKNLVEAVSTRREAEPTPDIPPKAVGTGTDVAAPDDTQNPPPPSTATPEDARAQAPSPAPSGRTTRTVQQTVLDKLPQQVAAKPEREDHEILAYAEFLVPERDALLGFIEDALPITSEQLTDVMNRFVRTEDGKAPPISGTLAAKVLARWSQLEPTNPRIEEFAREVLDRHHTDDPRFLVKKENLRDLAALVPDPVVLAEKDLPFTAPLYLTRASDTRVLGHSGITSVSYQHYDEVETNPQETSLYDTIVAVVHRVDPRALAYDVVMVDGDERTRSKLKPIQGTSEGLASVFGSGRADMFIDDFMGDDGFTFALINPTNWTNANILEINVKMRLKGKGEWGDVVPTSGMENYTHGYSGESSTTSKGSSASLTAKLTAARAPEVHVGTGSVKAAANNGYNRSLSTGKTVVSEQTVYDWAGHAELDMDHETIVTVRRRYMNERWLNNLSLTAFNRGDITAELRQHLYGTVSIEIPLSIAMGSRPLDVLPPTSRSQYAGRLPGDATVTGNTMDGLASAAQRLMKRIEGDFWTVSNLRHFFTERFSNRFETSPSAVLRSLLTRTQLNGHIPAAIGGGVHRLAENLIIPGHPEYAITVDMFGELIRRDGIPAKQPEVLLEMKGSGSGRYDKYISSINHSVKVDNLKIGATLEAGYNYSRTQPSPDGPRADQTVGGGTDSSRAISTSLAGAENRNSRDEKHIKQLVKKPGQPDQTDEIIGDESDQDADTESKYIVRFTARFRLNATVRNRNLPEFINPWTQTYRSPWVEGAVYATMTKSQYNAMMSTDYEPTALFRLERRYGSLNRTGSRQPDTNFHPDDHVPRALREQRAAIDADGGESLILAHEEEEPQAHTYPPLQRTAPPRRQQERQIRAPQHSTPRRDQTPQEEPRKQLLASPPLDDHGQVIRIRRLIEQHDPLPFPDHFRETAKGRQRNEIQEKLHNNSLYRYEGEGIMRHFADLPNQAQADAALHQLIRDTDHLEDLSSVRAAFDHFSREDILDHFGEDSGAEASSNFMRAFRIAERTTYRHDRPLATIGEEGELDDSSASPGSSPDLPPLVVDLPPDSPRAETLEIALPAAGDDPTSSKTPPLLTPQVTQEERVIRQVRRLGDAGTRERDRYWALVHRGVADTLGLLPNRDFADRVLAEMVMRDDDLDAAFNQIAQDQLNRIFAADTRWEARDLMGVLVRIRAMPYPVFEETDIWRYVEEKIMYIARR